MRKPLNKDVLSEQLAGAGCEAATLTRPASCSASAFGKRRPMCIAYLAGTVLSLLLLTSCSRNERRLLVGVPQVAAEEMWEGMHAGLLRGATEAGYRRYWNGPTHQDDVQRQIAIVERQLARSPHGLALAPGHASMLVPVIREAQQLHIPVVLMESQLTTPMGDGVVSVSTDNRRSGELAADYLSRHLSRGAEVAMLGVDPAISSNYTRSLAFQEAITGASQLRLVDRSFGDSSLEENEAAMEQMLREHPMLRAVFAGSLSATRAAHNVLARQRGPRRILIVGCDQDRDVEELVRNGEIDAIVAQNSYEIGYRSAQMLAAMDQGRRVPEQTLLAPHLFSRDTIDSSEAHRILVNYTGWTQQLCTFCLARPSSAQ